MRLPMVVLAALFACSPACGEDDDDDSTNEGAAGAASEQWTCELDDGDCYCRRDPTGSFDACAGTLPCCLHYVVAGDGGEICSCRNADETECAEFLMAAEDQQGERVPKCPP